MATPTYPGVYVEEVSSGVRPITIASTSTAAFVGQAERGSITEAVKIYNFTEFQNLYGGFMDGSYLAESVFQFFNNGGSICYVVRVAGANTETADVQIADQATTPQLAMTILAASPGLWGNNIEVGIAAGTTNPNNEFNLYVYNGNGAVPVETYENLTMIETSPNFVATRTSTSSYVRVVVNTSSATLSGDEARGSSTGGDAPVVPLVAPSTLMRINVNGDGYQGIDLQQGIGGGAGQVADLATAANIAGAIQFVVRALTPLRASTAPTAFSAFSASVVDGVLVLQSGAPSATSSVNIARAADPDTNATGFLRLGALDGGEEIIGGAVARPFFDTGLDESRYLLGDHSPIDAVAGPVLGITAGSDGDPVISDVPYINALSRLDDKQDVSLLVIPGIASPSLFGDAISYCENRSLSDCFFIGDVPQDVDTVAEAQGFVGSISPKNSYGALYMPWVLMNDPTGLSAEPLPVPPSGFLAGLYAKTDAQRGVWKAPAGTAAALSGSTGLTVRLTDVQQGELNPTPYHVNVLREFAASGRVIWGARTITSDAEWNYIPVRRMAILLRVSIYRGIQWAVFEPNDAPLWAQLRLNITSFMMTLYRRGAFQGSTPADAFFVKVDSETTTQDDINSGIVNIQIGFAPLKPAEFVMVQISQKAGQSG
jgi:phage tail sheath protein FI